MKKFLMLIIFNAAFLILNSLCFAQNKNIDSLLALLKKDNSDTNKVIHSNNLCRAYSNTGLYDTALHFSNDALQLSKRLNFKKGIANSYGNIGAVHYFLGDYLKTLEYWNKALKVDEELKNKNNIATRLGNIGAIYYSQGDYPRAMDFYFKALKTQEELGNKNFIGTWLGNIGLVYWNQGDFQKALDYSFKALKIDEDLGNKSGIARNLGNIGLIYLSRGNYSKALDHFFRALKMDEETGDKILVATTLGNIGKVYHQQGEIYNSQSQQQFFFNKALGYYFKALKIDEASGNKSGIATHLGNISLLNIKTGKFKDAEQYLKKCIIINDSIGALKELMDDEEILSHLYDTTDRYKEALIHYKKAIALKDTIFSQENKKELVRKEMNYEFDKKEAVTKAENEKLQAVAEEKSRKQKFVIWSVATGLLLVIIFAGFIFRSLRITRKQKNTIELQKNEVLKQKNIADGQRIIAEELREISEKQKHIVEEKQKEIVDSITYARRIQRALLTSDEYIKNNFLAQYFILFKPKDIVSGDFYWAYKSPSQHIPSRELEGAFYMATADCTGHGVPGAFMSMLNISYFNENVIERGIRLPHDILNTQRTEIIKALNPPGSKEVSKDGMDCILCVYDFDKMLLYFAAANNPLWLVRKGELIEYKADKMPVGKYTDEMLPFTLQTIELQKGDIVYTSTDGFADQFGVNGKKLMKKTFKDELLKIYHQPMSEQKEYLDQFFENWKGNSEQVDDVCIIGVRI